MKLSPRFSQIFALLVITLVLLATNIFASAKPQAKYYSPQASTSHTRVSATSSGYQSSNSTYRSTYGILNQRNTFTFAQDGHALRPNRFTMPEPVRYAIATSFGHNGGVRRKAPVKRKGRFQH